MVAWTIAKIKRLRRLEARRLFLMETLVDLCKLEAWPIVKERVQDIERIQGVFRRIAQQDRRRKQ